MKEILAADDTASDTNQFFPAASLGKDHHLVA